MCYVHDDAMTWKCFLYYWPFVRGVHLSPVDSAYKGSMMQTFDISFDVILNKQLDSQMGGEARYYNVHVTSL